MSTNPRLKLSLYKLMRADTVYARVSTQDLSRLHSWLRGHSSTRERIGQYDQALDRLYWFAVRLTGSEWAIPLRHWQRIGELVESMGSNRIDPVERQHLTNLVNRYRVTINGAEIFRLQQDSFIENVANSVDRDYEAGTIT